MRSSNAERQAAYRVRQLKEVDGQGERLDIIIECPAKRALERLAICYRVTQKELVTALLLQAEQAVLLAAGRLPSGQADYYAGRLSWSACVDIPERRDR